MEDPSLVKDDLETWLSEVTTQNDTILKKAREYIDECPSVDGASQPSTTAPSKNKQPSKTSSAKTSRQSRTSNQRQRDLLIAKQRREEIEKQNEAALRIAKQQQELELERLQQEQDQLRLRADRLKKEQALRVEELQEENRKKLAEATLTELNLRDDLSDSQPNLEETLSKLSVSSKADETARINDWVNNSPIVTEPAPTNARPVTLPLPEQVVLPAATINSVVNPVTGIATVHTTTAPVASTPNNPPEMQLRNNTVPISTMAATHLPVNPPVTRTATTNVTATHNADRNGAVTTVNRTRKSCFTEFICMDVSNCHQQRADKCDSRHHFDSTNTNVTYSGSYYHWLSHFNTRYSSHCRRNRVLSQPIVPGNCNNAYYCTTSEHLYCFTNRIAIYIVSNNRPSTTIDKQFHSSRSGTTTNVIEERPSSRMETGPIQW